MPSPGDPPFRCLLVANRGEIAARIIRACAVLGIRSAAVYSEADRDALHVRIADDAYLLGPGPAADSYLSIPRVLDAARRAGADAIHPGYGFLSEQADFAEACASAGIVFIGPTPAAMRLLGDKSAARQLAAQAGVPTVPGYDGAAQDDATLTAEAARIGYPVLVKAAAGGGGRGMRVAGTTDALPGALAAARREALAAFGDGTLLLERLLIGVRHIEVQVLGDHHGALVHLGERDCSVQRRHQKVVEESPAPGLSPVVRAALGDAALRIARDAAYTNAGTCEFLMAGDGQFWFIEMNARLQVEHPVTEAVTGIDLVCAQIEVAAGRPLTWGQDDVVSRGHAIECRLYAEDPDRDDLPATGRLVRFRPPAGPGLRHDVGYADGDVVPAFYDTMLGKLIAHGPDRTTAIARAKAALEQYDIAGLPTNRRLLTTILDQPAFSAGTATTDLLATLPDVAGTDRMAPPEALAAAAAWELAAPTPYPDVAGAASEGWPEPGAWAIAGQGIVGYWLAGPDAVPLAVVADRVAGHVWQVRVGDLTFLVTVADAPAGDVLVRPREEAQVESAAGQPTRCRMARIGHDITVHIAGHVYAVRRAGPPAADARRDAGVSSGASSVIAPLPGRVVAVLVAAGGHVAERQPLIIVEAMKIESTLVAPRAGTILTITCAPGDAVAAGQVLVELVAL
jgi:3-methylcrotonyl-CoA carboxylase alpha subunit